ncbi:MAG: hypothetical protein K6A65_01615 [Succinivibrionaceae bacterium]|nr:hypothetical protein [Succinivibrionaceae bacterium]
MVNLLPALSRGSRRYRDISEAAYVLAAHGLCKRAIAALTGISCDRAYRIARVAAAHQGDGHVESRHLRERLPRRISHQRLQLYRELLLLYVACHGADPAAAVDAEALLCASALFAAHHPGADALDLGINDLFLLASGLAQGEGLGLAEALLAPRGVPAHLSLLPGQRMASDHEDDLIPLARLLRSASMAPGGARDRERCPAGAGQG